MTRSLFSDLAGSVRHHEFWTYSSWLDIAVRYRRTKLGLSWILMTFAFFVLLMGVKFAYLMGVEIEYFLPYVAIGYLVWRLMVTIINETVTTYTRHSSYIMDGRSRLTDFLLRSMTGAVFNLLFALPVVLAVLIWSPKTQVLYMATLLLTLPLVLVNMFWLSVVVSLIGARMRDAQELVGTVLMAGFLVTPIIWDVARFPADTNRGFITRLNPAFHLIEVVRAPVFGYWPEWQSLVVVVFMALFGWLVAWWMYRRYARFVPLWVV